MNIPFWLKALVINLEHRLPLTTQYAGDLNWVRAELDAGRPVAGQRIIATGPDVVMKDGDEMRNCVLYRSSFFGGGSIMTKLVAEVEVEE